MGSVRQFIDHHFLHFNAGEVARAARAFEAHLDAGGKMMITLAGAMSTARLGRILARMIREDKVHAITCTGANLEEDVMVLCAAEEYEHVRWRELGASDDAALYDRGMNRVTDVCIPETVMRSIETRLLRQWQRTAEAGERKMPHEHLWGVLSDPTIEREFQLDPAESWVLAAKERQIPIWTPGWEDSTTGNMFAAHVFKGDLPSHDCVISGTEQMERLMRWYLENHGADQGVPSVGFFQIGGGIAGDFPICAVPALVQDLQIDVPMWGYFCQIGDAPASYGGYSGAPANEKITWGKLKLETPKFMIQSDASIVAPLMFGYVLGD